MVGLGWVGLHSSTQRAHKSERIELQSPFKSTQSSTLQSSTQRAAPITLQAHIDKHPTSSHSRFGSMRRASGLLWFVGVCPFSCCSAAELYNSLTRAALAIILQAHTEKYPTHSSTQRAHKSEHASSNHHSSAHRPAPYAFTQ